MSSKLNMSAERYKEPGPIRPRLDENAILYTQQRCYNKLSGPYECLSTPWWVKTSRHPVYEPRHGCELRTLNCGEEVFQQIQHDIKLAKKTVDIITWGFDPGMVLVREGFAEKGMRYGDLLREVSSRKENPVIVRILVWHDDVLSYLQMKNNPGYYGSRFSAIGASAGYFGETHQRFNAAWFEEVIAGRMPNISLRVREVPLDCKNGSLADEKYDIQTKGWLGSLYATHHQKMLLVDYELPQCAVGYVMGHNSLTDFWDTKDHVFQDPRRETFYRKDPSSIDGAMDGMLDKIHGEIYKNILYGGMSQLSRKQERLHQFVKDNAFTAKPYQDVSMRVRGPILYDLNNNFCQGWNESRLASNSLRFAVWAMAEDGPLDKLGLNKTDAAKSAKNAIPEDPDAGFIKRRKGLQASVFALKNGRHSAQLLRTQPMHREKGIKECYSNFARQVQHYIFLQNQYIQYDEWATYLSFCVERLRNTGPGYKKPIYVFILTSTPESAGMDLPTYAVAKEFGHSSTMVVEHKEAEGKAKKKKASMPLTVKELSKFGINVIMGSLWSCASRPRSSNDYEEIYIHAKVAIVDDAAFTVGSANLNVRSMALDSELNVVSQAAEVAFDLREKLFLQCTRSEGPAQYGDMGRTFDKWTDLANKNLISMRVREVLSCQLVLFNVDRQPGSPII